MLTVNQLIETHYSKSWQSRIKNKVAGLGVDLQSKASDTMILFLGNFLSKINQLVKNRNNEKQQQPQSSQKSIEIQLRDESVHRESALGTFREVPRQPRECDQDSNTSQTKMRGQTVCDRQNGESRDVCVNESTGTQNQQLNQKLPSFISESIELSKKGIHRSTERVHRLVGIATTAIAMAGANVVFDDSRSERGIHQIEQTTIDVASQEI